MTKRIPGILKTEFYAFAFLLSLINVSCVSHSPIGNTAIVALVIVEVTIAFSIGILCIIFSCNLLKAVSDSDIMLSSRELPRSKSNHKLPAASVYPSYQDSIPIASPTPVANVIGNYQNSTAFINSSPISDEDELEFETSFEIKQSFFSFITTFTDYLSIW